MPRIRRAADVVWRGNVARGEGSISAGTGAFTELPYSLPTRIGQAAGKTSPEELLAAAHAGCYAMSLAGELGEAGTPPERLSVTATCTVDEVEGGHRVVAMDIRALVRAAGVDAEALQRVATAAHEGCTISRLVEASAVVTIEAELEES